VPEEDVRRGAGHEAGDPLGEGEGAPRPGCREGGRHGHDRAHVPAAEGDEGFAGGPGSHLRGLRTEVPCGCRCGRGQ